MLVKYFGRVISTQNGENMITLLNISSQKVERLKEMNLLDEHLSNDNKNRAFSLFAKRDRDHFEQVRDYMNLLAKIGYTSIKGYVWYVDREEIIDAETEEI